MTMRRIIQIRAKGFRERNNYLRETPPWIEKVGSVCLWLIPLMNRSNRLINNEQ